MTAFKRILSVSALFIGATAFLGTSDNAQAQTSISIGIGGPGFRPVPAPIIRPVPMPIVYPAPIVRPVPMPIGYPTFRPIYPSVVPITPIIRDRHDFDVLYRDCAHDPWRVYGRYDCREDAERAAFRLQRFGNEVHIQTVHNHR